ncbi:MAG: TRAP transporter substrate-binding protein [Pseudorhodobacter sp.]
MLKPTTIQAMTVAVAICGASSLQAQEYKATLAHFASIAAYQAPAAAAFKNYVEVASGGNIEISITTIEALGPEREVVDQVRLGELQFVTPNAGGLAGAFPSAQVWNLPFLFPNRAIAWATFQDRDYIKVVDAQIQKETGGLLRYLGAGENSVRHLYTTRGPIREPQDMATHGIKIRTMEVPMHQQIWTALMASSIVALPAAERYTALQTGMIDATEGGLNSALSAGLLEVAPHVSLTAHMYDVTAWIANAEFMASLPENYQRIIEEGVAIATHVQNGYALTVDNATLIQIIEAGMEVVEPNAEEREKWRELAAPVGERFVGETADADFVAATLAAVEKVKQGF